MSDDENSIFSRKSFPTTKLYPVRRFSHTKMKKKISSIKRANKSRQRKVYRGRKYFNNYMKPIRIPVRVSIPWSRTSGTTGKWYFHIKLSSLIEHFTSTYDEFKIIRLTIRWLPNNSTSSQGLCAAVLMDQNGFGDFGSGAASSWFTSISAMPGSYVGNRHMSFRLNWRPTEPDSRNWRSYQRSEAKYVVCSFYMADNGSEDSETGGVILVSGTALGRGMYYNASTVSRVIASRLRDLPTRLEDCELND